MTTDEDALGFAAADPATYAAYASSTSNVVSIGETPWERQGQALTPLWMPHQWKPQARSDVRRALAQTGAAFAQWTEGWDTSPCEWWYICCDDGEYDLSRLQKGPRSHVRRGLAQCEVRTVDPQWFAQNGYPVYRAAFRHYGSKPSLSESGFVQEFTIHARYPGRETWGAFVAGKLVAWVSCLVIGDAAISSSSKSDPAYFQARPNNALLYVLTRHYLQDRGLKYVSAGARVLRHQTNVQDFKEHMGYRRVYCRLQLELGWKGSLLNALRPQSWPRSLARGRLSDAIDSAKAFAAMVEIARSCSAFPTDGVL